MWTDEFMQEFDQNTNPFADLLAADPGPEPVLVPAGECYHENAEFHDVMSGPNVIGTDAWCPDCGTDPRS